MKAILTIFVCLTFYAGTYAQCNADAGIDQHKCLNDTSNQSLVIIGGNPSANFGTPPYSFSWSINPIEFVPGSSIPYLYASDILNDTTISNPHILYETASDSIMFYLTITDSLGCTSSDSCVVTFTLFGQHLIYHDYWINEGDSVFLNQIPNIGGGYGETIYDWNPSYGLSDTTLAIGFWASPDTSTAYTATLTDSKGCTATAGGPLYYIWINTTGLNENNIIPIKLYPNPSSNIIFIETDSKNPILKNELYSLTGEKLANFLSLKDRIDLSTYSNGTYILKLYFNEGIVIQKVIKE